MLRPINKISVTANFERSFHRLPSRIQQLATFKDKWFRINAFDKRLKSHPLKGRLKGLWAYSVTWHYRILFEFITNSEVLYYDIGTHEIYR